MAVMPSKIVVELNSDVKAAFAKLWELVAQVRDSLEEMESRIGDLEDKVG